MKLKVKYDDKGEIPKGYEELYAEQDGAFVLVGVEGVKSQADVDRLTEALRKEREDHKTTKSKLRAWGERTPETVEELENQIEELKARIEAGGGRLSDEQLDSILEKRLPARLRPLQRELEKLKAEREELVGRIGTYEKRESQRLVLDAVRDAARGEKKVPLAEVAMPDVELLAERVLEVKDGKVVVRDDAPGGFTPGLSAREWLIDVQQSGKRPHWFIGNVSAGAEGGGPGSAASGENPFAKETFNLTKVGQLLKSDPNRAKRLAVAAKRTDLLPEGLRG